MKILRKNYMKIETALILCAGFGKRLHPMTLETPKPLLKLNHHTMLETCINTLIKLGVEKIYINTFFLKDKIFDYIKEKNFSADINIIEDGKNILDTGGGILNLIKNISDKNFFVFNPDTLWNENYIDEIEKMQNFYFTKKINNLLLVVKKNLSFDKNLLGDFVLQDEKLKKNKKNSHIYIGCQILNKDLFKNYEVTSFSVGEIWNKLIKKNELNGFESFNKFYHLTDLNTFKKLQDL